MKCCLCGSISVVFFLKAKKRILEKCLECNSIYVRDNLDDKNIDKEDSEKFVREYLNEKKLYEDYFNNKLALLEKYKKPGTILDIGCGAGVFMQSANAKGWLVTGVDASRAVKKYARGLKMEVKFGKIENIGFKDESFDVITMFQTIEHIGNPLSVVMKVRKLLKPGGIFLMTTPDENGFMARLMGKRWFGYRNIEHLFFYNTTSFRSLLKIAGFNKIKIEKEAGRVLTASWVLTRIFGYYYSHHTLVTNIMEKFKPTWKYFDWIKLREPEANLVAFVRK